jgi:hypothetical protein
MTNTCLQSVATNPNPHTLSGGPGALVKGMISRLATVTGLSR